MTELFELVSAGESERKEARDAWKDGERQTRVLSLALTGRFVPSCVRQIAPDALRFSDPPTHLSST